METFFVNIFPSNDRRQKVDTNEILALYNTHAKECDFVNTLFTVGDKRLDPWTLAQEAFSSHQHIQPIIALNPLYLHPVEAAKRIASLFSIYEKIPALNLVTGSFFNEMKAVGDELSLTDRSKRLVDFHACLSALLKGGPVNFKSSYYQLNGAEIYPRLDGRALSYFVSGTLSNDFKNADSVFYLKNMKPLAEMEKAPVENCGLLLGICARETRESAIEALKQNYPEDRRGEMLFDLTVINKETPWNQWLKDNLKKHEGNYSYCLLPMKHYWSAAPFIVGSYKEVADSLKEYRKLGYRFFVMDYHRDDFRHVKDVLKLYRAT